uniref:Polynucleotide kinase-3'-phosphatase n=1 Tax=Nilaparvata lugens TaxID=108931 RepID=B8ZX67_NILLU|nr:polynucleotide kinase-3'-phosphatase [Nilaparvata lugens]
MMSLVRKCVLKSISNSIQIELPHSKQVFVGRGPETEIVDTKLSKRQVSLVADVVACTVTAHCLGGNPSVADGVAHKKGDKFKLNNNSKLELLAGKHIYEVKFSPIPIKDRIDKATVERDMPIDEKDNVEISNRNNINDNGELKKPKKMDDSGELTKKPKNMRENEESQNPSKKMKLDNGSSILSVSSNICDEDVWESIDQGKLLIYSVKGLRSSSKIASYDMDGTIILTKSGKVFPVDKNDWKLFSPAVKSQLKKLHDDNFKIVIFTNQAGISRGKTKVDDFKYKVEKITSALDVPVQVFVATSEDKYRKPVPGMWEVLIQKKNDGLDYSESDSFFVGDAAGRVESWAPKKKKDFSCADRLFALNVGIKFYTPDAHFLKLPEGKFALPGFNPSQLFSNNALITDKEILSKTKEVVVMVGSPGSGKSFFANSYLVKAGYSCVNRDTLGSWQKCVSSMESALHAGNSVVVDNTNPDQETRKRYIDVAAKLNISCRCFLMSTTLEHARRNNKFRQLVGDPHVPVNTIIINSYGKKFVPPMLKEGFSDIVEINFFPKFDDPVRERLYRLYLLEK